MAVQSGVYRGVTAEKRTAARRASLMESTLAVWADPERRTTMTAICVEAGLTERYFYESFRSLDEALTAVMEAVATEIEETTRRAADEAGDEPAARVRASMEAFVQLLVDDARKGRVAIVEAGGHPALRVRRTELLRHFAHRSAEEAQQMANLPRRSASENEVAGLLFIGGMAELITAWLDGSVEATTTEVLDAASRSFLGVFG